MSLALVDAPPDLTPSQLAPGLLEGVPGRVYYAREYGLARKSVLELVHRAPAVYRSWLDGAEDEETPALAFGRAFHAAVLEPERFDVDWCIEPDFGDCRFKENKAVRDAWRKEHEGVERLSSTDDRHLRGMARALRAHPVLGPLLRAAGVNELTVRWDDPDVGLPCVARIDRYARSWSTALDLKSTEDARPHAFARSVASYLYHWQEAFYRRGFEVLDEPLDHFLFAACEKAPPYLVQVYSLDVGAVARGRVSVQRELERLAECCMRNDFPGYPDGITTLELPRWAQD